MASGDVNKVAEVVRDLWRRDQDRGLSAGEKRMLAKARQILVGELALAGPVDDKLADDFEARITEELNRQSESRAPKPKSELEAEESDVDLDDIDFDD